MPLKRYLALFGHEFYPMEGMEDLVDDFDTKEEAIARLETELAQDPSTSVPGRLQDPLSAKWNLRWGIVWDSEARRDVWWNGEEVGPDLERPSGT